MCYIPFPKLLTFITHCHVANNFRKQRGETRTPVILSVSVVRRSDKDRLGGLTRRRRLDLELQVRDWSQPSNELARQAKINSRSEESIQHACQRSVKLPSMMDSLDVHSLFAARLWSSE